MKTAVLATALLTSLQQASPLSITSSQERSTARQSLFVPSARSAKNSHACQEYCRTSRRGTALKASTFAPNNSKNPFSFLFPDFSVTKEDRDVSLLSLEGGQTKVTWPNLLATPSEVDEQLVSEISSLSDTFSDLQSSMDVKSTLYEETLSTYRNQMVVLQEENSFLEEGMKMLTLTLEKQADEIAKLTNTKFSEDFVRGLEEENELLKRRVRGLEVELSDVAFESRKIVEPASTVHEMTVREVSNAVVDTPHVTADLTPKAPTSPIPEHILLQQIAISDSAGVDLTPKAPNVPVPPHILQQRQVEQLQMELQVYKEERASLRKLVGLCFTSSIRKVRGVMDMWRPVYLILADARKGGFA